MHTSHPIATTTTSFQTDNDFIAPATSLDFIASSAQSPSACQPPLESLRPAHRASARASTPKNWLYPQASSERSFTYLRPDHSRHTTPIPPTELGIYSYDFIPDLPPGKVLPAIGLTAEGRKVAPTDPSAILSFWQPEKPELLPTWQTLMASHSEMFQGSGLYRQTLQAALTMAKGPIRVHLTNEGHDWPASIIENTNKEKVITINPDLMNNENKIHEIKKAFVFELHNATLSEPFRSIRNLIYTGAYEEQNDQGALVRDNTPESRMKHLLMRHASDHAAVTSALDIENIEMNSHKNTTKTFQDLAGLPLRSPSHTENISLLRHQTLCGHTQKYVLNYNTPFSLPSDFFINPLTKNASEDMYSLPLTTPLQMQLAEQKIYNVYNQESYCPDLYRATLQTHIRLLILKNSEYYECYMKDDHFNTPEPENVEQEAIYHAALETCFHRDELRLTAFKQAVQSLFPNVQSWDSMLFSGTS